MNKSEFYGIVCPRPGDAPKYTSTEDAEVLESSLGSVVRVKRNRATQGQNKYLMGGILVYVDAEEQYVILKSLGNHRLFRMKMKGNTFYVLNRELEAWKHFASNLQVNKVD